MKSLSRHISQSLNEGITYDPDHNQFIFNYNKDSISDVIKFNKPDLYKIHIGAELNDIYYFGYEFEKTASSKIRTEFFNQFRFGSTFTSVENKKRFINDTLVKLNKEINLATISTIVFPHSRSIINREIVKEIGKFYRVKYATFELLKQLPNGISFDVDKYSSEILDNTIVIHDQDRPRYTAIQKAEALNKVKLQLDAIRKSDYFSIAGSVQSNKLKPYFNEFLRFKSTEEENAYKSISQDKLILIIDAVTTTGSTIIEIVKTLRTLNPYNKIIVFTIVGKQELV